MIESNKYHWVAPQIHFCLLYQTLSAGAFTVNNWITQYLFGVYLLYLPGFYYFVLSMCSSAQTALLL